MLTTRFVCLASSLFVRDWIVFVPGALPARLPRFWFSRLTQSADIMALRLNIFFLVPHPARTRRIRSEDRTPPRMCLCACVVHCSLASARACEPGTSAQLRRQVLARYIPPGINDNFRQVLGRYRHHELLIFLSYLARCTYIYKHVCIHSLETRSRPSYCVAFVALYSNREKKI